MTSPAPSPTHPDPSGAPFPATQAALADMVQLGMILVRANAALAEGERRAAETLVEVAVEATRLAVTAQDSLEETTKAVHLIEANNELRDTIAARLASITDSFDKACRAVRRVAWLQARLAERRPLRRWDSDDGGPAPRLRVVAGSAPHPANDAERAERMDQSDCVDEIHGRSDEDVVRDIQRDLDAAAKATNGADQTQPDGTSTVGARDATAVAPPSSVPAGAKPTNPARPRPPPDT